MKCTTYRKTKGKDIAVQSIITKCNYILNSNDSKTAAKLFRQVCGTVFYVTIFNLPEQELIDGRRYTIDSVKESLDGFIRDDAENWLNNVTDCSSEYAILAPLLEQILHEATITEICTKLGVPYKEFYLATLRMYLFFNSEAFPSDMLDKLRSPDVEFYDVWNIFEDCIYRKGDKYNGKI